MCVGHSLQKGGFGCIDCYVCQTILCWYIAVNTRIYVFLLLLLFWGCGLSFLLHSLITQYFFPTRIIGIPHSNVALPYPSRVQSARLYSDMYHLSSPWFD